jgi:hypothetical protein
MIADLIAEGDHDGYKLLARAAIPVTWGHAMEVPDMMLKCMPFLAGDHAAKMFNPGAATSGYKMYTCLSKEHVNQIITCSSIFP